MKPKRNSNIQTKLLPDGHVVIFSDSSDWAQTITPLAAIAWEYCDGEHSIDEIISCVKEYAGEGSDTATLEPILCKLLRDFEQSGLITDFSL